MFKRFLALVAAVGFFFAIAGCNTMEGLGKDLRTLGGSIEKKAEEKK